MCWALNHQNIIKIDQGHISLSSRQYFSAEKIIWSCKNLNFQYHFSVLYKCNIVKSNLHKVYIN
jgi:hypothetical protein